MRELTMTEAGHVAGGLGILGSIAVGVGAAYVYEKLGGAKGIEKLVKAALEALAEGGRIRSKICQETPSACMPMG